jgi:hypothetical protein
MLPEFYGRLPERQDSSVVLKRSTSNEREKNLNVRKSLFTRQTPSNLKFDTEFKKLDSQSFLTPILALKNCLSNHKH